MSGRRCGRAGKPWRTSSSLGGSGGAVAMHAVHFLRRGELAATCACPAHRIWMPFYYDGACADHLRALGFGHVHHRKEDFFVKASHPPGVTGRDLSIDSQHCHLLMPGARSQVHEKGGSDLGQPTVHLSRNKGGEAPQLACDALTYPLILHTAYVLIVCRACA